MKPWIRLIFTTVLAVSCAASDFDRHESTPEGHAWIEGCITDSTGIPIEHIKITISASGNEQLTIYSASDGKFMAEIRISATKEPFIDLLIEDIDGEENGGHFETKTDRIALIPEDRHNSPVILSPVYRLSLSTASENSPQT